MKAAAIRFAANVPVEVALQFDGGKQVKSRIFDAPDQMMYTVCGDDAIYVPLSVASEIAQLGIKKMELISICRWQQGGVTRWEVKRLSEAAQPAPEPSPQRNQVADLEIRHADSTLVPIAHTVISKLMAASLIAAFDATQEAERYAHTKGVEIEFGAEDIRAISNTIFIALSKDPAFAQPVKVNGGAQLWQQ